MSKVPLYLRSCGREEGGTHVGGAEAELGVIALERGHPPRQPLRLFLRRRCEQGNTTFKNV